MSSEDLLKSLFDQDAILPSECLKARIRRYGDLRVQEDMAVLKKRVNEAIDGIDKYLSIENLKETFICPTHSCGNIVPYRDVYCQECATLKEIQQ